MDHAALCRCNPALYSTVPDDSFAARPARRACAGRPRKSPANISMTRRARVCSSRSANCRNITRPAPRWRCCAAMPARSPRLIGRGCRDRGIRRRLPAQGAHPAGCARNAARLHANGYFRRLSAGGGARPGGGISRAWRCGRWWAISPAAADLACPAGTRAPAAPVSFPAAQSAISSPMRRMALLRRMRASLNGGGLLIGVDLVKDPARLHAAYNDAAGVTAAVQQESAWRGPIASWAPISTSTAFAHYAPYNARRPAHRNVSGQPEAPERDHWRRAFRFRGRRAGAHRGQPQIHHRKLPRDGGARRLQSPRGVDRRGHGCSAVHWLESCWELGVSRNATADAKRVRPPPKSQRSQDSSAASDGLASPSAPPSAVLPKNSSSPGRAATPITIMVAVAAASLRMASAAAERARNAGGHRHAIAFAQLGHVLEHALLAQAGARMPVGLGDEQGMHLRARGARQRQRDLGGAARLRAAVDRHQDAGCWRSCSASRPLANTTSGPSKPAASCGQLRRKAAILLTLSSRPTNIRS